LNNRSASKSAALRSSSQGAVSSQIEAQPGNSTARAAGTISRRQLSVVCVVTRHDRRIAGVLGVALVTHRCGHSGNPDLAVAAVEIRFVALRVESGTVLVVIA